MPSTESHPRLTNGWGGKSKSPKYIGSVSASCRKGTKSGCQQCTKLDCPHECHKHEVKEQVQ
jgi:hypothetical protein